jgi:hypothetical protein
VGRQCGDALGSERIEEPPTVGEEELVTGIGASMTIEVRLAELGLTLPAAPRMPMETTFTWVRRSGNRLIVSGHGAQQLDGSPAGPFGRVPDEVSLDQAQESAKLAALSVMASVAAELGNLDQVTAWLSVTGFVNAGPGYRQTTAVLNAFSQTVLDVFGPQIGRHSRTAIGVSALPLDLPVVAAAEIEVSMS